MQKFFLPEVFQVSQAKIEKPCSSLLVLRLRLMFKDLHQCPAYSVQYVSHCIWKYCPYFQELRPKLNFLSKQWDKSHLPIFIACVSASRLLKGLRLRSLRGGDIGLGRGTS